MTNEELTQKVIHLDETCARHSEQIKTAFNQINEVKAITEGVHKLATNIELLAHEQKDIGKKVDAMAKDIDVIKEKPAKRWDNVMNIVLTVIVTAVVTFIVTKFGL